MRSHFLRTRYGMSPQEFAALYAQHGGKCGICRRALVSGGRGKDGLAIDHDHTTGAVRGLLCNSCNRGLGHFNDNPELLNSASSYLTRP